MLTKGQMAMIAVDLMEEGAGMKFWKKKKDDPFVGKGGIGYCFTEEAVVEPDELEKLKVKDLEKRVQQLECEHGEWKYNIKCDGYVWVPVSFTKECGKCGKTVTLDRQDWLQEQADLHYEEHCHFIEKINMLSSECEN